MDIINIEEYKLLLEYPSMPKGVKKGDIVLFDKSRGFYTVNKLGVKLHINLPKCHTTYKNHWRRVDNKESLLSKICAWVEKRC